MIRVPFLRLDREARAQEPELVEAFRQVLASGIFLHGPKVRELEEALAARAGVEHAIGVGSGTQALQTLLLGCGVGPGDEVITTPATYWATSFAIQAVGAIPVFVDVDPHHYLLDPALVEAAITPATRAILAVHLYGRPAPVRELSALARRHGLHLLEDAAQAIGAEVDGRPVGAWGDGAIYSFYPTKNLGALGEAGAVLVRDATIAARVRSARSLGWSGVRDWFDGPGISGRMDELQAALLLVRLRALDEQTARRRALAERYRARLPASVLLPPTPAGRREVHHLFVIRHPRRDRLAELLEEQGIGTLVHYRTPAHLQPALRAPAPSLPVAERWASEVLSLPLYPGLGDDEQERVIVALARSLEAL